MSSTKILVALLGLLCVSARAQSQPAPIEIKPQDFYQRASATPPTEIRAKQLSDWLTKKSVVLIDLRAKESYDAAHIRGAINVPIESLTTENLQKIVPNRGSRIVVYCANNFMPTRMIALTTLGYPAIEQLGYRKVHRLEDLWRSESCRESEKLAGKKSPGSEDETMRSFDAACESLLPMERSKK